MHSSTVKARGTLLPLFMRLLVVLLVYQEANELESSAYQIYVTLSGLKHKKVCTSLLCTSSSTAMTACYWLAATDNMLAQISRHIGLSHQAIPLTAHLTHHIHMQALD
jgi:hypothetical protein